MEIENIKNNTNGEIPNEKFTILRVKNVQFPEQELNDFKSSIKTFLENESLSDEDPTWKDLLPERVINFTEQLTEHDYLNDDLITHISNLIYKLQSVKQWKWYSSKLTATGFEVYFTGRFRSIFFPIPHHQGIPHSSLFIEREGVEYPAKGLTDVLTYRKWNPETLVLSPGRDPKMPYP